MGQSHLNIHTWYMILKGKISRQNGNFASPGPKPLPSAPRSFTDYDITLKSPKIIGCIIKKDPLVVAQHHVTALVFSWRSTCTSNSSMCDSKRTSQTHTLTATLCEGDKGGSGEREQITSQRQQLSTKPKGKIIMVQRPHSGGIYNF